MTEFEKALEQVKNGEKVSCYGCDTTLEKHLLALVNNSGIAGFSVPRNRVEELLELIAVRQRNDFIKQNDNDKFLINLGEAGANTLYKYQIDNTLAYSKIVPNSALPYAKIDKVGGMSYKSENLLILSDVAETTVNGITYSIKNGVITCNGTATVGFNLRFEDIISLSKGNYSIRSYITGETSGIVGHYLYDYPSNVVSQDLNHVDRNYTIEFTLTEEKQYKYGIYFDADATVTSLQLTPTLVKGKTVGGLIHSCVTNINELVIPDKIQALDGYGMGINDTYYNYIDFNAKKYVQNVASYTFTGEEEWLYNETANTDTSKLYRFNTDVIADKIKRDFEKVSDIAIIPLDNTNTWLQEENSMQIHSNTHGILIGNIFVFNSKIQSHIEMQKYMKGKTIVYALEKPIETDISNYIDNNYIKVEPNGTIVFENEYKNEVPNSVNYCSQETSSYIFGNITVKQTSSDIIKDVIHHFVYNEKTGIFIVNEAYILKSFYSEVDGVKKYIVNMWSFFGSYITSDPDGVGLNKDEIVDIEAITYSSYNIRSIMSKVNALETKVNSL